ncbi:MAG: PglL family O-oligosaccharyltransferase [Vibrio sp.]
MAILLTKGTQLEEVPEPNIVAKPFLWSLGVVFMLAMHYFQPNPGGAGILLPFNATTWLTISISIGVGLYATANYLSLRLTSLTLVLFAVCAILTLPIFYLNANIEDSVMRIMGLWGGWLLLFLLHQFPFSIKQKQTLLWFIVGAVSIEILIAYSQYLLLEPGNIFGYDTVANRPFGIFQQPNVMASFLATGLAVSGYLLAREQHTNIRHHPVFSWYLAFMPLAIIPLLWVLASRTGWLAGAGSVVLLIPYLKSILPKRTFTLWMISIMLGLVGGYSLASINGGNELIAQKSNLESPRRYTFPQTLDMVIEHPVKGYGYGKFEAAYILYTARQHQLNPDYNPGLPSMDHPHNEILYWAVEGGVVAALGLLLAILAVLRKMRKAQHGTRLALMAMLFPIVLHTQLEYPFYHSTIHWVIFIILIYWIDQLTSQYQVINFTHIPKMIMRVFSLMIPIVTSFFMITALHTNSVLNKFEHTRPFNPDLLDNVSNPSVWKDRFDWDVYHTQLKIGLHSGKPEYIQPYIGWATEMIQRKPRVVYYRSLIKAYQGIGKTQTAEEVRDEAEFLFPNTDWSKVNFVPPKERISAAQPAAKTNKSKSN